MPADLLHRHRERHERRAAAASVTAASTGSAHDSSDTNARSFGDKLSARRHSLPMLPVRTKHRLSPPHVMTGLPITTNFGATPVAATPATNGSSWLW